MSLLSSYASPWKPEKEKRQPVLKNTTIVSPPEEESSSEKSKMNDLINKITKTDSSPDDNRLANFKPPPNPILNKMGNSEPLPAFDPVELLPKLPGIKEKEPPKTMHPPSPADNKFYGNPDNNLAVYNNYKKSYEPPKNLNKPYYSKMGISGGNIGNDESRLMEKINYMIHMLEEQQNEKTEYITEEFILYSFLGVFIIFIVDSFSKAGKYTR